jgi:hypothetical protein
MKRFFSFGTLGAISVGSLGIYGGYRYFSDNGKELTLIQKSTPLPASTETSLVKMNGIVGRLVKDSSNIELMTQYLSGNRLINDVQLYPICAEHSSFLLSRTMEESTENDKDSSYKFVSDDAVEYDADNNVMALLFEIEQVDRDNKFHSRSQWIVMRPSFAAKVVDEMESNLESYNFSPDSNEVYELDTYRNCYFEFPENAENSIYTAVIPNPMEYVPPQSKRELLQFLVEYGKISYPKEWTFDDLMQNVKAHIIHRTKPVPIPAGQRVRVTEAFINTGDRIFICGEMGNKKDESDDDENWKPYSSASVVKCKLLVNGKTEKAYKNELRAEILFDTIKATLMASVVTIGALIFL